MNCEGRGKTASGVNAAMRVVKPRRLLSRLDGEANTATNVASLRRPKVRLVARTDSDLLVGELFRSAVECDQGGQRFCVLVTVFVDSKFD